MDLQKMLDDCRVKVGASTDYQLSKRSGLSEARISDYRRGNRLPNAQDCFIMADLLGMDAKYLIAYFEGLGAKNQKTKEFWQKYCERLGGLAAGFILVFVTLIVTLAVPAPAEAAQRLDTHNAFNTGYTLCEVKKLFNRLQQQLYLSVVKIISFCRRPVLSIG